MPYVHPKFPPKTIKELIAFGKTNPVPFGSAGLASMTHLAAETLKDQHGITLMQHVVYRGGSPALNDVLAGTIPMTMATVTQALPQYQAGLLGALAVTVSERHRALPEVPTFREQGFDLVVTNGTACSRPPARRSRSSPSSTPRCGASWRCSSASGSPPST